MERYTVEPIAVKLPFPVAMHQAAKYLYNVARALHQNVTADYNGTPMLAYLSDSEDQIVMRYYYERLLIQIANGVVNVNEHANPKYVRQDKPPVVNIQQQFKTMTSWDRKAAEISRARSGLPPLDDLEGMSSWDKRAVLQERTRAELRKS